MAPGCLSISRGPALRRQWAPLVLAILPLTVGWSQTQDRGFQQLAAPATTSAANGNYYALVIGINKYPPPLPQLKTAVNDAKAVGSLLHDGYGFEVQYLLDGDATRFRILDALSKYRGKLNDNDNLLIYYGGHGYYDHDADKAYWLPVDADSGLSPNTIMADDLTSAVRALPSRHVLIVSDSCYSGGLTRAVEDATVHPSTPAYLNRKLSAPSRTLMASGGNEPVSDSGADGHSVFAFAVIHALDRASDPMFTARDIFYNSVEKQVAERSTQLPQYTAIRNSIRNNSAPEEGDFVFTRKLPPASARTVASTSPGEPPPNPAIGKGTGGTGTADLPPNTPPPDPEMSASEAFRQGTALGQSGRYADEFPLMTLSCNGGYAKACTVLGGMYRSGKGVNADSAQADAIYRKACDWGEEQACTDVAGPGSSPSKPASNSRLDDIEIQVDRLAGAAAGLNNSLNNMQQQMRKDGRALNEKWVELQSDMNSSIGKAQEAVKTKDPDRAARFAALADSDIRQLKTFLGR